MQGDRSFYLVVKVSYTFGFTGLGFGPEIHQSFVELNGAGNFMVPCRRSIRIGWFPCGNIGYHLQETGVHRLFERFRSRQIKVRFGSLGLEKV
jgi:hypothetical protein